MSTVKTAYPYQEAAPKPAKFTLGTKKNRTLFDNLKGDIGKLPDEWVICRDLRHAWQVLNDFHTSEKGEGLTGISRELVCLRCSTIRRESYENNRFGLDRVSTSYVYPQDYQIHGVPQGLNLMSLVRQDQYRRAMDRIAAKNRG